MDNERIIFDFLTDLFFLVPYLLNYLIMSTTEKFYNHAVHKLEKGATLNELYELLYKYERLEDYDACAGIHKAIKDKSGQKNSN